VATQGEKGSKEKKKGKKKKSRNVFIPYSARESSRREAYRVLAHLWRTKKQKKATNRREGKRRLALRHYGTNGNMALWHSWHYVTRALRHYNA